MYVHYILPPDASPFQRWLIEVRRSRNLSRRELAEHLGISTAVMAKLEVGSMNPSDERLAFFEERLGRAPAEVTNWQAHRSRVRGNRSKISIRHTNLTAFAEWLRESRTARGLDEEALASLMGIPLSVFRSLEKGTYHPTSDNLSKLALIFGPVPQLILIEVEREKTKEVSVSRLPDDIRPPFGRVLRKLRSARSLSQSELARSLGGTYSEKTISDIERGVRQANESFLQDLADRYSNGVVPSFWRTALHESKGFHRLQEVNDPVADLPPLGALLSRLRRERIGNRAAMAEALDVNIKDVRNMEFGNVPISSAMLAKIAGAFGLKMIPKSWFSLRSQSGQTPSDEEKPLMVSLTPFGRILRAERNSRKLSRQQMAEIIGITPAELSRIEYGRLVCVPEGIVRLASGLGYPEVPQLWIEALDAERQTYARGTQTSIGSAWSEKIRAVLEHSKTQLD